MSDRLPVRENSRVEAVECGTTPTPAPRRGARPSPYAGIRVRVAGGPREGQTGSIIRRDAGLYFDIAFDDGSRHLVMRHLVLTLDGAPVWGELRRPNPDRSPAARVAALHAAGHARVVVYRSLTGRVQVRPWNEQDVGPGLIGVYAQGVDPRDVEADLR